MYHNIILRVGGLSVYKIVHIILKYNVYLYGSPKIKDWGESVHKIKHVELKVVDSLYIKVYVSPMS